MEEQIENKKREIVSNYTKNLEKINKKIFYEIHEDLLGTWYPIWKYKGFEKIINAELLPKDFYKLNDEEKYEILCVHGTYDYNEFWHQIKETKPFWNLDNIKEDIKITNVVIDADYNKIAIEFNGMCNCFVALIEITTHAIPFALEDG